MSSLLRVDSTVATNDRIILTEYRRGRQARATRQSPSLNSTARHSTAVSYRPPDLGDQVERSSAARVIWTSQGWFWRRLCRAADRWCCQLASRGAGRSRRAARSSGALEQLLGGRWCASPLAIDSDPRRVAPRACRGPEPGTARGCAALELRMSPKSCPSSRRGSWIVHSLTGMPSCPATRTGLRLFDSVAAAGLRKRHAPGRADGSLLGRCPGDPATLDGKGVATAAEGIAVKARRNDVRKLVRRHRGAAWRRSGGWHETPVGMSS